MNIAFDALAILGPMSKNRGIGNYALSQFREMIRLDRENNYFLFNCLEPFTLFNENEKPTNYKEEYFYLGKDNLLILEQYQDLYGELIKKFLRKNCIDVFYITSPFESQYPIYRKEWFNNTITVATIYDIIPYVLKDTYLKDNNTYKWYMRCIDMLRWVDKYLVISNSVKKDLVNFLGFKEEKISTIWGAVNSDFRKILVTDDDKQYFKNKYGITKKFIMCTGGDDGRKNIAGLIEAFSGVKETIRGNTQLVIVCKISDVSKDKYVQLSRDLKIEKDVIFTNFVTDEELLKLYNMAYLVAFPSKYEGFGLPVVEAFACGTPVLTSNNSSLVEIAGNAAYLVDPFDSNDITKGLEKAILDSEINKMIDKGYERLKLYQWSNVARKAINSINTIYNQKKNRNIQSKKESQYAIKKRIAMFTPLPPIKSGISDYSVDIIKVLSKYFDIDVIIDNYKHKVVFPDNVKVLPFDEFDDSKKYYKIIYQLGNSDYHYYMYDFIKKYKGIIVLHDYNLHGAFYYNYVVNGLDIDSYKRYLLCDFEEDYVNDYINKLQGGLISPAIYDLELNGFLTKYGEKIIVHSDEAKEKMLIKDIGINVKTIKSYAVIEDVINITESKQKLNIDEETILIAAFGHVHENKRAIPILKAFNKIRKDISNVKLVYVGQLDKNLEEEFNNWVGNLGLRECVSVTGYCDLERFNMYLNATDICLNLRYPYNGETSGVLMRSLGKGKCTIVNKIGSFDEIPDEVVIKLDNVADISAEDEVENIYIALKNLVCNPSKLSMMGLNAINYAKENLDIGIIAEQYKEYIIEDTNNRLSEEVINYLAGDVDVLNFSQNDIKLFSRTLAYLMN